jgi:alanyl-tRNA synthetase
MFLITSEGSAAAGIRRIEAITGRKAYAHVRHQAEILRASAHFLSASVDQIPEKIDDLLQKIDQLERDNKHLKQRFALSDFNSQIENVETVAGIHIFEGKFENVDIDTLRTLADKYRSRYPENSIGLFAGVSGDKPVLIGMVAENLTKKGIRAGDLVKHAAGYIGGSGGGKPTLAQAGGKDIDKIEEALNSVRSWVRERTSKQAT